MKFAKALLNIIGVAVTIYIGVFFIWLLLAMGCMEHDASQCGDDSLTRMVRTTHAPILSLMFGLNK